MGSRLKATGERPQLCDHLLGRGAHKLGSHGRTMQQLGFVHFVTIQPPENNESLPRWLQLSFVSREQFPRKSDKRH